MREQGKKKIGFVVVWVSIVLASTAGATILGTVDIQHHNNDLSDQAQLWGGGLTGGTYYTGIYSWVNEGGTGLGTQVPNWGFCIELTQAARNGWQDVIPLAEAPLPSFPIYGTPMGTTKANYIRELWGRNFDPSWITNPTSTNKQMAEAFSAALWEIVYESDPTWDVISGTGFHSNIETLEQYTTANLWLSQLNGNTAYFANGLVATDDGQDYVVQIPEPATMSLLTLGVAMFLRKRSSNK